jgi:hypothetical protein
VALAREITIGRIPANLTATLNANLKADVNIGMRWRFSAQMVPP